MTKFDNSTITWDATSRGKVWHVEETTTLADLDAAIRLVLTHNNEINFFIESTDPAENAGGAGTNYRKQLASYGSGTPIENRTQYNKVKSDICKMIKATSDKLLAGDRTYTGIDASRHLISDPKQLGKKEQEHTNFVKYYNVIKKFANGFKTLGSVTVQMCKLDNGGSGIKGTIGSGHSFMFEAYGDDFKFDIDLSNGLDGFTVNGKLSTDFQEFKEYLSPNNKVAQRTHYLLVH